MKLDPFKYKETELWNVPGWEENRVKLLNEWARASLRKQTCQDFTFVSLWWDGRVFSGGELDNEIRITIKPTGTEDDEPLDYWALTNGGDGKLTLNFADQIRDKIRQKFDSPLLVTNLDCDDALNHRFVETLQSMETPKDTFYFSSTKRYCYNLDTGQKGVKVARSPSPFVSTWEPEVNCYPLRYNHSLLNQWIDGKNVKGLEGLQTVSGMNMFSQGTGQSSEFELSDYI